MLKYCNTLVGFREVPDEISLCIEFSNCPNRCENCHSPHLWEDKGEVLTDEKLIELINKSKGITCVCFMGGDSEQYEVLHFARLVLNVNPRLKTAWYSGRESLDKLDSMIKLNNHNFDYIKVGPYIEELGGLDSPKTNQKMYKRENDYFIDITKKFLKNETKN